MDNDTRQRLERLAEALVLADPESRASLPGLAVDAAELVAAARSAAAGGSRAAREHAGQFMHVLRVLRSAAEDESADPRQAIDEAGRIVSELQGRFAGPAASPVPGAPDARQEPVHETPPPAASVRAGLRVPPLPPAVDERIFADFLSRQPAALNEMEQLVLDLEKQFDAGRLQALSRRIHTLKGEAGLLGLVEVELLCHRVEDTLSERGRPLPADALLRAKDWLQQTFAYYAGKGDAPGDVETVLTRLVVPDAGRRVVVGAAPAGAALAAPSGRVSEPAGQPEPERAVRVQPTVSVNALKLDALLDALGELMVTESALVRELQSAGSALGPGLASRANELARVTRRLQDAAMSIRMVPLRSTFATMSRLVRDLSTQASKPVQFVTSGGDIELDRSIADRLGEPLVHLIRNAISHGIESPGERGSKPATGRLELTAVQLGASVRVTVSDDGRGIDTDAVRRAAVERGLISADDRLGAHQAHQLILEPGFSTAPEVTGVSGRGVGLDVVRRHVQALGGTIEVSSERGHGCSFRLSLPLTLAVLDGMLVRSGDERYVIPTLNVVRLLPAGAPRVQRILAQAETLVLEDRIVPLLRLGTVLGVGRAQPEPERGAVVVVDGGERWAGVVVDELLGTQAFVVKELGPVLSRVEPLAGCTVLPDGLPGLILDPAALTRLSGAAPDDSVENARRAAGAGAAGQTNGGATTGREGEA